MFVECASCARCIARSAGIRLRLLPRLEEIQSAFALVQAREARYLSTDVLQTFLDFRIGDLAILAKNLPRLRNRRLFRDYPGVQRAADVAQRVQRVEGAHSAARDAYQSDHLALELIESHQ